MIKDIIIYSCLFGDYDNLKEPLFEDLRVSFFLFTDNPGLKTKIWTPFLISKDLPFTDPQRKARYFKLNPHLFLPKEHKINVWVDSSFLIQTKNISLFIKKILGGGEVACYKHGKGNDKRNCLYEEAEFCIQKKLDNTYLIQNQINKYKEEGFPKNFGLFSTGFLIRKNNERVKKLNNLWWEEVNNGSKRDQISLTYCSWKLNILINQIMIGQDVYNNPFLKKFKHLINRKTHD